MKKLLTTILILSMILSIPSIMVQAATFTDIDGHWARANIEAMTEAGYLNGYPDGTFRPDAPVTRAEFAKIICAVYDLPTSEYGYLMYGSIWQDDWFAPYVPGFCELIYAPFEELLVVHGWPEQLGDYYNYFYLFDGHKPLTRIEAAQALISVVGTPDNQDMAGYIGGCISAAGSAADYAEFIHNDGITFLVGQVIVGGLMTGDEEGRFRPYDTMTRAELCTVISRAAAEYGKEARPRLIERIEKRLSALEADAASIGEFMSEDKKTAEDNIIAATIDGEDISLAEYNLVYNEYAAGFLGVDGWESLPYVGNYPEYIGMTYGQIIAKTTLQQLAALVSVGQEAARYGLDNLNTRFEAGEYTKNYVKANGYQEFLKDHTTDYAVEKIMYRRYMGYELMDYLTERGIVTVAADEVNENYTKASHVLIMIDEDTSDEEALSKANEVIARLDAGEDMAALIAEYGEDPGMKRQEYYIFTEGEMVNEFYEGARAIAPGEHSPAPVKTSYGYHVIYRFPLTEADEGYAEAAAGTANIKLSSLVEEWTADADIQINPEVMDRP